MNSPDITTSALSGSQKPSTASTFSIRAHGNQDVFDLLKFALFATKEQLAELLADTGEIDCTAQTALQRGLSSSGCSNLTSSLDVGTPRP